MDKNSGKIEYDKENVIGRGGISIVYGGTSSSDQLLPSRETRGDIAMTGKLKHSWNFTTKM